MVFTIMGGGIKTVYNFLISKQSSSSVTFLPSPACRHFLLRVADLLIVKIIPEITDTDFQKHLSQLRTIRHTHSAAVH
jgi:hypothetical protein